MDFIGVTRTIDQAIYMLLNALAIVLWRIDSAIIGMSLYSYATQDWLTGNGGGVWYIMDWLLDTSGLFGLNTWTLFAGLALMLWGLSRIARPFIPSARDHPGKLLLFFGARTPAELPYFGPLKNLPKDFIDINFAFSREVGKPRRYVQDVMRERAADLAPLLADPNAYFYVCGLKAMEEGVVLALRDVAAEQGLDWATVGEQLKSQGRLHLETY